MLNPFINPGLETALKELFRDDATTEQLYQTTATEKEQLIVYVYPNRLEFVFVAQEELESYEENHQKL